jgi:hypothetical protein
MFFAANVDALAADGYNLLLDVARFADEQGFSSVWLPERHFTPLGGAYPAPAILHGALAMCTKRVRLHAGSDTRIDRRSCTAHCTRCGPSGAASRGWEATA